MNKNIRIAFLLCVAIATIFLTACGDSVEADGQAVVDVDDTSLSKEMASSSSSKAKSSSSSAKAASSSSAKSSSSEALYPESFKPDDAEYPYAGIPRIVIETEKRQAIKDRETEIPAKLQIWGEKEAESEVLDLTIRGRGNTSWTEMPKKSYKIEFAKKQSMLGMPKDKDWALIANYADKTLMRNFIAYRLSAALGAYYAPRCEFAELYLNGEYLGVYLLTETIKVGKNRVYIPNDDYSYIVEVDRRCKKNEQCVFSYVIPMDSVGNQFRIHDPKNASAEILDTIQIHIQNFEKFLKTIKTQNENDLDEWIDVEECVKYYWVQEFSKNADANFFTSVYFSWMKDGKIKMGPVWDFDLAYGNHYKEPLVYSDQWYVRSKYWNEYLFKDSDYRTEINVFWEKYHDKFTSLKDSVELYRRFLKKAANNNFKRWDILNKTDDRWLRKSYSSYKEAVADLTDWISERTQWIDGQLLQGK